MHTTKVEFMRDRREPGGGFNCRLELHGSMLLLFVDDSLEALVNFHAFTRVVAWDAYPDDSDVDGGNHVVYFEGDGVDTFYVEALPGHTSAILAACALHIIGTTSSEAFDTELVTRLEALRVAGSVEEKEQAK
jgi:hypothetical protein